MRLRRVLEREGDFFDESEENVVYERDTDGAVKALIVPDDGAQDASGGDDDAADA